MTAVRFAIRVKPNARRAAVGGRWDGPHGPALVVAVTAPAVDGKANEAVITALAKELGVRRSQLQIVSGERSRDKIIEYAQPSANAGNQLAALLDASR